MIEAYGDPWQSQVAKILDDKGLKTQLGYKIKATEYFNDKDYEKAIAEAEHGLQSLPGNGTDAKGRRLANGVYFYALDTGTKRISRKVVLTE